MGQEFARRVDGYNRAFAIETLANIANPATVTAAAPAGPGRIERFNIKDENATAAVFNFGNIIITIDGTVLWNNPPWKIWDGFTAGAHVVNGPNFSFNQDGSATRNLLQVIINLDYESSASIAYQPNAATVRICGVHVIGRMGR
jgi:hypothetical protein